MQMPNNLSGKIQTVTGTITRKQLGTTLTHEHLFIDLARLFDPDVSDSNYDFFHSKLNTEVLGAIRYYHQANHDNYQLLDKQTAIDEILLYKKYGGVSVVDATSIGISRNPEGLRDISKQTGINIIMGSGFYVNDAHPDYVEDRSEDALAEHIIKDIINGVDGSGIKSGIIGEIGCSWPLTVNERKVLVAAVIAQKKTGGAILIHPGRDEGSPKEIFEVLITHKADLSRTILGHIDRTVFDREQLLDIAGTGCYLEWDLFGNESSVCNETMISKYLSNPSINHPNDGTKLNTILDLVIEGYGNKILFAQDICTKHRLIKYGGHGYAYILRHIVPHMYSRGFTKQSVENILVNNPADVLTFL